MTQAEIRFNLILLGVIFGISAFLFWGRSMLLPPTIRDIPAETGTVSEQDVLDSGLETNSPALVESPVQGPVQEPEEPLPAATPVRQNPPTARPTAKPTATPTPKPRRTSLPVAAPPPEKPVPPRHRGTLIFVFDDAGHNLPQLSPYLKLPFPCTIAVLPGLQYSQEAARRIRAAGKEVILHQPMQAINLSMDPGPGAIRKGMGADQIRTVVRANLAEIGPVVGINNHEGSLITADRQAMAAVLEVVREKKLFFLDSRTNSKTVVPALAREHDMKIWERAVFLDNSQDRESIIDALNNGMKIAERKGAAIMIGHIWSNDLAGILSEMYPELVSQGFSLSTIAQIAISGEIEE